MTKQTLFQGSILSYAYKTRQSRACLVVLTIVTFGIILWYQKLDLPKYWKLSGSRLSQNKVLSSTKNDSEIRRIVESFWNATRPLKRTSSSSSADHVNDTKTGRLCASRFYKDRPGQSEVIPTSGPLYQCVGNPGRLGNAMFVYASSLGVARLSNRTMVMKANNPLLPHFKIQALVPCYNSDDGDNDSNNTHIRINNLCSSPKLKLVHGCCIFNPTLLQPEPSSTSLKVGLYLQSWRYFHHVEKELRQQFTTYGSTAMSADVTIGNIRGQYEVTQGKITLVGIHVRRGDMTSERFRKFGYRLPPVDYFRRAMAWYVRNFPHVVFVISSNIKSYVDEKILPLCGEDFYHGLRPESSTKQERYYSVKVPNQIKRPEIQPIVSDDYRGAREPALQSHKNLFMHGFFPSKLPSKSEQDVNYELKERKNRKDSRINSRVVSGNTNLGHKRRKTNMINTPEGPKLLGCHYVGSSDHGVDMAVLGSCDHFIVSVGTFGWWSGWLTGGTVVYYRHPALEGSVYSTRFSDRDHFPPHWVPME